MMSLGELKPILATLVLPPAAPLLLALLGLLLAARKKAPGLLLAFAGLALLWFLSCHAVAVWLAQTILPQHAPLTAAALKSSGVQAIVVLGGGVQPVAPEYGQAQSSPAAAMRLRYGAWLARQTGLPVAFAGGMGWGAAGAQVLSEGEVARRMAEQDYGLKLRWIDDRSRDTAENANLLRPLLEKDGVRRIALVTHAWHMPRSVLAFERAGFTVTAAPMGFTLPSGNGVLEWLPSGNGLEDSRAILREWLALRVARP
ncbi:MAG: YdcF family protein [Polaromonas sp.]|uniref:YdcF family protein n=1 Tax=Polaromonas sp. TaxID=1869339 RepID=UPI0027311AC8|nr:YdcF family protein [Polaromonas sp.]MDP2452429.1 YdcF family protein [Polaromonas sp.]MDP3246820.1 YdcF family protein [Polaromonas sp.]MDP3753848.1 YdcF family protein [Polaromonas sp.]MDP3828979.1 YdcF family protein [Polaromonas sp.]